jgi:hypothetical protein
VIRIAARNQILVDPDNKIQIVQAALHDDSGLLGAAFMARESLGYEDPPASAGRFLLHRQRGFGILRGFV